MAENHIRKESQSFQDEIPHQLSALWPRSRSTHHTPTHYSESGSLKFGWPLNSTSSPMSNFLCKFRRPSLWVSPPVGWCHGIISWIPEVFFLIPCSKWPISCDSALDIWQNPPVKNLLGNSIPTASILSHGATGHHTFLYSTFPLNIQFLRLLCCLSALYSALIASTLTSYTHSTTF